jgi:hypothetical protein
MFPPDRIATSGPPPVPSFAVPSSAAERNIPAVAYGATAPYRAARPARWRYSPVTLCSY